jgi:hypothetical protein
MGFIYEGMNLMKEIVRDIIRHSGAYLKIIEERWTEQLLHPLHKAGKLIFNIFHVS